jgi:ATP-dependent Zn protease
VIAADARFSGADLANLINEAAYWLPAETQGYGTKELEDSSTGHAGPEDKARVITMKEKGYCYT